MATNEQMPEPANDSAEEIDAEAENIVTELLCSLALLTGHGVPRVSTADRRRREPGTQSKREGAENAPAHSDSSFLSAHSASNKVRRRHPSRL